MRKKKNSHLPNYKSLKKKSKKEGASKMQVTDSNKKVNRLFQLNTTFMKRFKIEAGEIKKNISSTFL